MSLVNFITEHWCKSSLFNIFLTVFSEVIVTSMNIYNATIHISIGKHRISHIRHFLHSSKPVKSDLSVDAVVTLLGAGTVPWGFDKSRCNGIDGNAFWLEFLYQGFGQEMDGCLSDSVYKGRRIRLLPRIGTGKENAAAFHHHGSQLFDHKYRHGKIGIYDPCPLLEAVVLIFRIGADAGVAYQPVDVIGLLFQRFHKKHHLIIGRHICLHQNHLRSFFLRKALQKSGRLLLIMSICYEDPVFFR